MSQSIKSAFLVFFVCLLLPSAVFAQIGGSGWSPLKVTFNVQSPTNVPQSARYFFTNNIYHCLTYSNDGAFSIGNNTLPRTEQRFTPDYTNGEIQYQARLMAVSNENSYCVFQIHTGDAESDAYGSTTFMLFWFSSDGGSVHDYSGTELANNLGNQWFQLNVDHNLVTDTIMIWVNQKLVWTQQDNGAGDFYMKDGVYEQNHGPTDEMDTFITNSIQMWVSSGTNPPAAPTGLMAASGLTQIGLSWNPSVDATNYNVKRSTANGGAYTTIASITGTNYTDTSVIASTTYYYVVSAMDQFGQSFNSVQVAATPEVFLSATAYWTNMLTGAAQNWNVNGNWTNASAFPNSAGELAVINRTIVTSQTIALNQAVTIGSLQIGDANGLAAYTIAANGGSLTFSGTNPALLTQLSTSKGDVLATPISTLTNLLINNYSTNPLVLAGMLSSSGGSILTLGGGTLQIGDNTTNGGLGSVSVTNNGALVFDRSDNVALPGIISGSGSLVQNGAGVLTLSGVNTYSGGSAVNNGTLEAGSTTAFGAGGMTVNSGATLDVGGQNLSAYTITVSGNGVNGLGAIVNSGAQQTTAFGNITLAGNTTFGGINRWDLRLTGGSLLTGGQPYSITKVGTNQVSLVHTITVDSALGNIVIQAGDFAIQEIGTYNGLGTNGTITVWSNATLEVDYGENLTNVTKPIILLDGATLLCTSGVNSFADPLILSTNAAGGPGDCAFNITGSSMTLSNVVSGLGNLIKNGLGNLILTGTNIYSGTTTIAAGTLALTNNSSISGSLLITVNAGATLNVSGRSNGTLTLTGGQMLTGNGTINGRTVVGNGATFAPGVALTALVFSTNLTLNGGSVTALELNQALLTNDLAQVGGTLTYGGTLRLTNLAGTLAAGDSFKLFNAAGYVGAFTNIEPAIPGINLAWDINGLTNGVLGIVAVPTTSPKFGAVLFGENGFIFSGSNGVPDWPYYLLASTNLTLPLTNWTLVSTGVFDGNGDFSFTNSFVPNGRQKFYLLKLQ